MQAAAGALLAMTLLLVTGCGKSSSSAPTTTVVDNKAPLTVGFGPLGANGGYINGVFTNITVCQHGTKSCVTVNDVLVDTGSVGLRIVSDAVRSLGLTPISNGGSPLLECIQYGDTSYSWGSMATADVSIAGETASNIAIQILGGGSTDTTAAPSTCITTPVATGTPGNPPGDENTEASLGANGILGIGNGASSGPWDCGQSCAASGQFSPYYICPGGPCQPVAVPTGNQAENLIAAFTSNDKNGFLITLPSVPPTGAGSVTGTITFGINTQTNNAIGTATVFAVDPCGHFPQVNFDGLQYLDDCTFGSGGLGGFMDTGSNALYVSDASTLASNGLPIADCTNNNALGFYCVTGGSITTTLSNIQLISAGTATGLVSLNIQDAVSLFNTNNAVFNDLGGDSCNASCGGFTSGGDFFDFGIPFFLGKTVFVGITGVNGSTTGAFAIAAPNGFVAF